jgi:hypothetical protein
MCPCINAFPEIPATSHLPLYTGYKAESFHSGGFQASSIHRGENSIFILHNVLAICHYNILYESICTSIFNTFKCATRCKEFVLYTNYARIN